MHPCYCSLSIKRIMEELLKNLSKNLFKNQMEEILLGKVPEQKQEKNLENVLLENKIYHGYFFRIFSDS